MGAANFTERTPADPLVKDFRSRVLCVPMRFGWKLAGLCPLLFLAACAVPPAPSPSPEQSAPPSASSSKPTADVREEIASGATIDMGEPTAPLDLVLFTNHACGYCRDFHDALLPRLQEDFIAPGKLRLRVALLPIRKYPGSDLEAAALFCAKRQDRTWELHDALFGLTDRSQEAVTAQARGLKMDAEAFTACLPSPEAQSFAQIQGITASRLGVTLAPTLFIGNEKHVGLPAYAELRSWIENKLKAGR